MKAHLLFALFFLLAACRVVPPYEPPSTPLPPVWKAAGDKEAASSVATAETVPWWHIFHSDSLNELEEKALKNNPAILQAAWKQYEALAIAKASLSPFYPNISLNPSSFSENQLFNIGAYVPASPLRGKLRRVKTTQYLFPAVMSYEVDLWSRYHYGSEAAFANAEGEKAALFNAKLSLTASVAAAFFQLRTLDADERILEKTIATRKDAYEINSERYKAGLINYADVSRAATELWLAKADLSENRRLRAVQENLLATLLGEFPVCFSQKSFPLEGSPPQIAAIVPSELLLSRPDLVQAEREVASLYAEWGVAYTALFPSFTISSQIGFSSPILAELFNWKTRFLSLTFNAMQCLFDAGKIEAEIQAAKARLEQSFSSYFQKVFVAFQEVEDSLTSIKWYEEAEKEVRLAQQNADISYKLSLERYNKGLVTYLEVVDSERTLLETELMANRLHGSRFISAIELAKALGGAMPVPE